MFGRINPFLFLTTLLSLLLLNSFRDGKAGQDDKMENSLQQEIAISFKLQKKEKCVLNYTNSFFEGKLLSFANAGNNDTTIVRTIPANVPLLLTYNLFILKKDGQRNSVRYSLFASPGDTLHLSFINHAYLNTSACKMGSVLSDSTTSYYTDENFEPVNNTISKGEAWEYFYQTITKKYDLEINRINNLLSQGKINSVYSQRLIINCKLHDYKRLLDWVFEKDGGYFKNCLPVILNKMPEMEAVLNDEHAFLSNELLEVIDGIVLVKVINQGKDYTNEVTAYDEACASDLGLFKSAYLTVLIAKSPVKVGLGFNRILDDYRNRYKNTPFIPHIDSVLKSDSEEKYISANDPLVNSQGGSSSWNSLIKSKKKFVVIDFWASWCSPCRHQLPFIDSLRYNFKNYPVEFVSVNIDENIDAWRNASKAEGKYLGQNNYHLINPKKSSIVNSLKLNSIPRYLVLNNNNKIIAADFYQPSEPSFAKELIQLIKP